MQPQFRPPEQGRAGPMPPARPPPMNQPGMNYLPPGAPPSQFGQRPQGPPGFNPQAPVSHPPIQKMAGLSLSPNQLPPSMSQNYNPSQSSVGNGLPGTVPPSFPGSQTRTAAPQVSQISNPPPQTSSPSPQTFLDNQSSSQSTVYNNGGQNPPNSISSVSNVPSSLPGMLSQNGSSNPSSQHGATEPSAGTNSLPPKTATLSGQSPAQLSYPGMESMNLGQPSSTPAPQSLSQPPIPTMSGTVMTPRPSAGPPLGAPPVSSSIPPGPGGIPSMPPNRGMRPMMPLGGGTASSGMPPSTESFPSSMSSAPSPRGPPIPSTTGNFSGMPSTTSTLPPGMPSTTGAFSPGMPPTAGAFSPGMPPTAGAFSPGMTPTTGAFSQGMPPSTGAFSPGMPPTTGAFSPGMPPSTGAFSPGMPPRPRTAMPPMPPSSTGMSPGMPPMPQHTQGPRVHTGMPGAQYPSQPMNRGPPVPGSQPPMPPAGIPQQGGMQNRYPGSSQMGGAYPQGQGRKLNPDDMPSPLQVIEDDQKARSGEFITHAKGEVPPLVTTKFVVRDSGNASPRFMRATMYSVPATPDMMKKCAVPFGVAISPYADVMPGENPLYLGTSLSNGPVRCNRCKAYMSPLMRFMDGGRRFQCLLCKQANEVPSDYYCHMDSQGARADKFQRPELCLGTFEYVATPEYCTNKLLPKEPAFIFAFEMSQMMLQRGIVNLLCQNMKTILENLPKDEVPGLETPESSKIHVGFITYDSSVHFYKLSGLSPEMCIVCDKENMFVPVPDGILCNAQEVADNLDKLMDSIPQNFQSSKETSGNLYGAINAGMAALKASGRAGKMFVFHSSLPQGEGLGKLKSREDRKVLGTEKEKAVLGPQNNHYNNLAQELVTAGCGVDLYLFNESYMDFATIGQVPRLTGGQIHKYTNFSVNRDGQRLLKDLEMNVGRSIAFDAVMRVRTSTGVRPVEFYGHFFMSNTHDVELAVIDSSKAIAVEIKHDDKITEEDGVYIQAALLYTSCGGQRRLRIINLSLNVCDMMADMYKNSDLDTIINIWTKESIFKLSTSNSKQIKENLVNKTAETLACYRKNCASPSSAGQLILPEQMKLLPLYINCLSRSDALSGGSDMTCDDRSWHMFQVSTMTVSASLGYLYPRLLPLLEANVEGEELPSPLRTSYSKLRPDGVFLLENGLFMFIWVGSGTPSSWMSDVFGVSAPHQLDPVMSELPDLNNSNSKAVRHIVEAVRRERGMHLRLFVVPQQGKHELVLRNYLIEDVGVGGAPGYVEFLCHVHKEIRSILS